MTRIELSYPPSVNTMFLNAAGKGRVKSDKYKAWRTESLWRLKEQKIRPVSGEISIWIGLVKPDKRRADASNRIKAVEDLLVAGGIIPDDDDRYVRRISAEWLADGPGCTILIQPVEGTQP